jgi:hypothetical protein
MLAARSPVPSMLLSGAVIFPEKPVKTPISAGYLPRRAGSCEVVRVR